jgi:hypothetical protein
LPEKGITQSPARLHVRLTVSKQYVPTGDGVARDVGHRDADGVAHHSVREYRGALVTSVMEEGRPREGVAVPCLLASSRAFTRAGAVDDGLERSGIPRVERFVHDVEAAFAVLLAFRSRAGGRRRRRECPCGQGVVLVSYKVVRFPPSAKKCWVDLLDLTDERKGQIYNVK